MPGATDTIKCVAEVTESASAEEDPQVLVQALLCAQACSHSGPPIPPPPLPPCPCRPPNHDVADSPNTHLESPRLATTRRPWGTATATQPVDPDRGQTAALLRRSSSALQVRKALRRLCSYSPACARKSGAKHCCMVRVMSERERKTEKEKGNTGWNNGCLMLHPTT